MTALSNMHRRPVTRSSSGYARNGTENTSPKGSSNKRNRQIKHASNTQQFDWVPELANGERRARALKSIPTIQQARPSKQVFVISSDDGEEDNSWLQRQCHVPGGHHDNAKIVIRAETSSVTNSQSSAQDGSQGCVGCTGASELVHGLKQDIQSATIELQGLRQFFFDSIRGIQLKLQESRDDIQNFQKKLADEEVQHQATRQDLSALQVLYDKLLAEKIDLQASHQGLKKQISQASFGRTAESTAQVQPLQEEAAELRGGESQITSELQLMTSQSSFSPAPSSSICGEEDRKNDNLRKRYVKVKSDFDELLTAVQRVCAVAKVMEIDEFGEVGKRLKELRGKVSRGGKGAEGISGQERLRAYKYQH